MRFILSLLLSIVCFGSSASAAREIHINIPEYTLLLVEDGQAKKRYHIAVGTPYEQTPVGQFAVYEKERMPTWYPGSNFVDRTPVSPGPANPLGTR